MTGLGDDGIQLITQPTTKNTGGYMGGLMSRNKGKRAERQVIDLLQPIVDHCYKEAGLKPLLLQRNTVQSDQGGFDIIGLEWLALEVKHQEILNVDAWWQQT